MRGWGRQAAMLAKPKSVPGKRTAAFLVAQGPDTSRQCLDWDHHTGDWQNHRVGQTSIGHAVVGGLFGEHQQTVSTEEAHGQILIQREANLTWKTGDLLYEQIAEFNAPWGKEIVDEPVSYVCQSA